MDFEKFKNELFKIIYDDRLYECLIKYGDSLEKIKLFLEKSAINLEGFEENLKKWKENDFKNNNYDFLIYKVTAALHLRYIIEIVVSMLVFNNKDNLKNNKKIDTGKTNKVIDVLYSDKNIDAGIFKGEINKNDITLYIHEFWTKEKLKDNYNFLSKQIHCFHELNESLNTPKHDQYLEQIDSDYDNNSTIFQRLKEIGIIIYNTLYNHIVSVEGDKAFIEIKNMKIFTFYPDKFLKFNKK